MITFIVVHAHTLKYLKSTRLGARVSTMYYTDLLQAPRLASGTYVFCDLERLDVWELRCAAEIFRVINIWSSAARAYNNPAKAKMRYALLRALYEARINPINVYRVDERVKPERYPVFIRNEFDHNRPLTTLLRSAAELDAVIAKLVVLGIPTSGLIIIEYAAEPVSGNVFRKYAEFRVGDEVFPHNCVHEENWYVKFGSREAATEELQVEAAAFVLNNPHRDVLERAFAVSGIDFGRADYGLVDGKPVIYEINTNPKISYRDVGPSPVRRQSMVRSENMLLDALEKLDRPFESAHDVALDSKFLTLMRKRFERVGVRPYRY